MLKIVHINTVASTHNSVGRLIQELAKYEHLQGNEVYIVAGYGQPGDSDLVMESRWGYLMNVAMARFCDCDGWGLKYPTRRLCKWLWSIKPDIIHIHNIHGYYLNLTLLADCLIQLNVRTILTLHDWWMVTGHCACIPVNNERCYWENGCKGCKVKLSDHYPATFYKGDTATRRLIKMKLLLRLPNLTVAIPNRLLKQHFDQALANAINTIYIPNGTDIASFCRYSVDSVSDTPHRIKVLAIATQWTHNKNIDALISLSEALPSDMLLTIVGNVNKKIPPNVRHIPSVHNRPLLAELYKWADVVVNPSFSEGFGMVPAEALTLGTPVIVNKASGTDSIITDKDGFAIDCNDTQLLIQKIRQAALLQPVSKFYLDDMINAYHQLYAEP